MRKLTKGTTKSYNQHRSDKIFYRSVFFSIGLAIGAVIVIVI